MKEFINIVKYKHIHALIQQFRFQEASNLLEILIQFKPDEQCWFGLRLICSSLGPNKDEFIVWDRIIQQKFPGSSQAWMAMALYPGVKIQLAKTALQTALKLDSENPYIYYFMAKTYLYLENYSQALKYSDHCLELDPNFHLAYFIRIECNHRLGNFPHQIRDTFTVNCFMQGMNMKHVFKKLLDELARMSDSSKSNPPD